jgi:hypothetical protein
MLATIELDDQFGFRTAEVSDERADGVLAAESRAAESAIAKPQPQLSLGIRLFTSQTTGIAT